MRNFQSTLWGKLNRHLQVIKMKTAMIAGILVFTSFALASQAFGICPYDLNCINNPYGAGNPYKADGLMNPYSLYGSPYSNRSWTNPFATEPPKIYDRYGNYRGRLSTNPYHPDSISNPFGRYGNPYSYENLIRRYGIGFPYSTEEYYIVPVR